MQMKQVYFIVPCWMLPKLEMAVSGSKKAVDCVILLCCSNMSETNKWKLMVLGKRTKQ
jgi:hypothetical protein